MEAIKIMEILLRSWNLRKLQYRIDDARKQIGVEIDSIESDIVQNNGHSFPDIIGEMYLGIERETKKIRETLDINIEDLEKKIKDDIDNCNHPLSLYVFNYAHMNSQLDYDIFICPTCGRVFFEKNIYYDKREKLSKWSESINAIGAHPKNFNEIENQIRFSGSKQPLFPSEEKELIEAAEDILYDIYIPFIIHQSRDEKLPEAYQRVKSYVEHRKNGK